MSSRVFPLKALVALFFLRLFFTGSRLFGEVSSALGPTSEFPVLGRVFHYRYLHNFIITFIVLIIFILFWRRILLNRESARILEEKRSTESYQTILSSLSSGVISADIDGVIAEINQAASRILDIPQHEAAGKSLQIIFPGLNIGSDSDSTERLFYYQGRNGEEIILSYVLSSVCDGEGHAESLVFVFHDSTEEEEIRIRLHSRLEDLTEPLDSTTEFEFNNVFDIPEMQSLQDALGKATGLSSVFYDPAGNRMSIAFNSATICSEYFRKTEEGQRRCLKSDGEILERSRNGLYFKKCSAAGLWDSGVPLFVSGHHVATWLTGQARSPEQTEEEIRAYADEIGCDAELVVKEYNRLPVFSEEEYAAVMSVYQTIGMQLSARVYQSLQQERIIKEKSRSEDEMKLLRNYLTNIINSMPSLFIGVNDKGMISLWNKAAEKETGFSAREAVGRPILELMPRMVDELLLIIESIRDKALKHESRKARKTDLGYVYENITIFPLSEDGDGAVIIIDDITERVKMEEVMIQNEKMLSVGGLAAGMAHEINNPLAGMLQTANVMYSRLLNTSMTANIRAADTAGLSTESIAEYMSLRGIPRMLESITESGSRVAKIIENMLTFSGKAEVGKTTLDITEVADTALKLAATDYDLKKHYHFGDIRITRLYERNLQKILCDGNQIQQVILNILRNGAQAMDSAEIDEPEFRISIEEDEANACISIKIGNNGPVMDQETEKRAFEPYFTTKDVEVGTGLGLSVSYYIITENHNGSLMLVSNSDTGVCFEIRLPV